MNATVNSGASRKPHLKNVAVWTLQVLGAAAFVAAGGAKLAGAPTMVQIFDQIGVGQWFRLVTGLVEVTGGVLLLIPRVAALGGVLLAVTMVCAVATHLFVIGGNPAPAMVLCLMTSAVVWFRRDKLATVFG